MKYTVKRLSVVMRRVSRIENYELEEPLVMNYVPAKQKCVSWSLLVSWMPA